MVWYFVAWVAFTFCLCSDMIIKGPCFVLIHPGHVVVFSDVDVL